MSIAVRVLEQWSQDAELVHPERSLDKFLSFLELTFENEENNYVVDFIRHNYNHTFTAGSFSDDYPHVLRAKIVVRGFLAFEDEGYWSEKHVESEEEEGEEGN